MIGLVRSHPGNEDAIDSYHERVGEIIRAIPVDSNGWVGQQVPLPQSATNLLRPNALVAREYVNKEKEISVTLMIVQCKDTRDMAGHYPPRCYPANGWLENSEVSQGVFTLDGQSLRRYGFHRFAGQTSREITVYNLFALPTGESTISMNDVRKLSADYEFRKFGAAQVQIVIDGSIDLADHPWILEQMYTIAQPAVEAVLDSQSHTQNGERGDS